jgi:hypothetical protein
MRRINPRLAWLAGAVAVAAAGLVSAQPAPTTTPPPVAETPPVITAAPPPVPPGTEAAPAPAPLPSEPLEARPAPAAPSPKPSAEAEAPPEPIVPMKRTRHAVAILQAIDKVTARSLRFEAPVGKPIRYENLVITVRACEASAPDEPVEDSIAYLLIDSHPRTAGGSPRQVYRGWMFASSPGLHPLEHPVYDAWLVACKATPPVRVAAIR